MKRIILFWFFALVFISIGCLGVFADSGDMTMPPEFNGFLSELPDDVAEMLPDELFSNDVEAVYNASRELTDAQFLLDAILSALGICISECVGLLLFLLAIILIGAVLRSFGKLSASGSENFTFCLGLVLYSAIISRAIGVVNDVQAYFDRLNTLCAASVPVMGALYALGGNITSAAVNTELMAIFLSVCQYVNSSTITPIFGLLLTMALVSTFSNSARFSAISDAVKRWYTAFLGCIMTLIGISMSLKSIIAVKADGVSMRGLKYIVSTSIPVVGGAISSVLSGLGAGIGLLRGVFGGTAIVILFLLIMPILLKLLLYKQVFEISALLSEVIGGGEQGKLLRDISGIFGFLIAATSISSVILMVSLVIFANTAVAFT